MQPQDAGPSTTQHQWLEIGRIVGAHGLQGEVKVFPDSDFPERFEQPGQRWLLPSGDVTPKAVELKRGRYLPKKGLYIVQFAGVENRTQAESLRGATLMVPAGDRPPLSPGEFHLLDLVGLTVIDQETQTTIGTVIRIANAGNDLLEVQLQQGPATSVLIPFVKEIVVRVDLPNHRIEIAPPPGLLSLNQR